MNPLSKTRFVIVNTGFGGGCIIRNVQRKKHKTLYIYIKCGRAWVARLTLERGRVRCVLRCVNYVKVECESDDSNAMYTMCGVYVHS